MGPRKRVDSWDQERDNSSVDFCSVYSGSITLDLRTLSPSICLWEAPTHRSFKMDLEGAAELQNQIPHCGVSPYRLKSQKAYYLLPPHPQPTEPGPARPSDQGNPFCPLRTPDAPFLGLSSVFFGSPSPSLPVQVLCPPCSHGTAGCL